MGVDSQEALEALFVSIDLDGDGVFNYNEICRFWVHDSDFFCGGDRIQWERLVIQPDYKAPEPAPTPFEQFWGQFDAAHMNQDATEISMDDWISASAGVTLFEDMTEAEVLAQFEAHDLNGDDVVTVEEAQEAFLSP